MVFLVGLIYCDIKLRRVFFSYKVILKNNHDYVCTVIYTENKIIIEEKAYNNVNKL